MEWNSRSAFSDPHLGPSEDPRHRPTVGSEEVRSRSLLGVYSHSDPYMST